MKELADLPEPELQMPAMVMNPKKSLKFGSIANGIVSPTIFSTVASQPFMTIPILKLHASGHRHLQ